MKKILIGIPTNKYIEPTTFKAIYDLEIPDGYVADFQYFFGYQIDQIRNLIAHWAINYDYLFSVDSDISFPKDTLKKLLKHDVDMVSGLYIQRKENEHILEIYMNNQHGGCTNIPYESIKNVPFLEIAACGMGCCLIKSKVFKDVGYPQFSYHSALDHRNTLSEDVDFCRKAKAKGFKMFADTTVLCEHTGSTVFRVNNNLPKNLSKTEELNDIEKRLFEISNERHIEERFKKYIRSLDINPKVIYDIGANALDWTFECKQVWPKAKFICFEAMEEFKNLYEKSGNSHHLGVLSDEDNKEVKFYQNPIFPWGNSYYKENEEYSPKGCEFGEQHAVQKKSMTLDTVVKTKKFPKPDLIKIDVQGAELDILKGAKNCLNNCTDLFLELQHKEYNKGAPNKDEVIDYLKTIGFELVENIFLKDCDGDYHFKNTKTK